MQIPVKFWAVIPAAGVGQRMGADKPKQYLDLGKKKVIEHTLERLLDSEIFEYIVVALSNDDPFWPTLSLSKCERVVTTPGGKERADSVLSGLNQLSDKCNPMDWVLVHDAARPCLTISDIQLLIDEIKNDPVGGLLALPVHDTLKGVGGNKVLRTIDRTHIWRALTPQMFRYKPLKSALENAIRDGKSVTDEASALELAGKQPRIVEGRSDNIKITQPKDLALAEFFMEQQCYE